MPAKRSYKRRRSTGASSGALALARAITKRQAIDRKAQSLASAVAAVGSVASDSQIKAAQAAKIAQMESKILGRGGYTFGKFIRQAEGYADRFLKKGLPNVLHAANLAKAGVQALGSGLYSGRGGYNNLISGGDPSMAYHASNDETESIVISNCEFLQDIYGAPSSAFFVESWKLNPGLTENFPWLAQIAQNYEEYEFIQLLYHFKSTVDSSATNNNNGATGTLIMATNYNATANNFSNKETMMQYHGANSGRITDDHTHGIECDPEKNAMSAQKYIRSLPVQVGQDLKTFDLGTFQLAQTNLPGAFSNQQIGELWVSYTVKLRKPKLSVALLAAANECRFVSAGGETRTSMLGTNPLSMQQNTLPISVVTSNPSGSVCRFVFTFPDFLTGWFEVQIFTEGSLFANTSVNIAFGGSCTTVGDILASLGGTDAPNGEAVAFESGRAIYIGRLSVQPSVAGSDNTYTVNIDLGNTALVTQTYVVIRQCNLSFGQSNTVQNPLYVNSLGVVTSTTA